MSHQLAICAIGRADIENRKALLPSFRRCATASTVPGEGFAES